jgi:hypothetical protein
MKKITVLLTLTIILLSATVASASKWVLVGKYDEETIYVDTESVKDRSSKRKVWEYYGWVKWIPRNNSLNKYKQTYGSSFSYYLELWHVNKDCDNYYITNDAYYSTKGSILDSNNYYTAILDKQPIMPDTIGNEIAKTILKYGSRSKIRKFLGF